MTKYAFLARTALYGGGVLVVLVAFILNQRQSERESRRPHGEWVGSGEFQQVKRHGSVDVAVSYDVSNLQIPADEVHTLLPKDAIPSLTDPNVEPLSQAQWLRDSDRVVLVVVGDEALVVPLLILDWHEVVNATVGGTQIAATYCPLCDSATVFDRAVTAQSGESIRLEFGVSGALYNSNVLMYDRTDHALWSQLGMKAVSGPHAGQHLRHLPIEVVPAADVRERYPHALVVSRATGHSRNYGHSPYVSYFAERGLMVPVKAHGDALEAKTLGIGVLAGDSAWFVSRAALVSGERTLETAMGPVTLAATGAGIRQVAGPPGVYSAQTFYFSWSAFYPETEVIRPKKPVPDPEKVE